jgi:integrase
MSEKARNTDQRVGDLQTNGRVDPEFRGFADLAARVGLGLDPFQRRIARLALGPEREALVELAKTARSRRQVPLSPRALDALGALPPRLDSRYLIPVRRGGVFDLHNFRRRSWTPAIEAAGVRTPARIYDLRSTFASNALAAGVSVFELARIMGTSVAMIKRSYGTLIEGAGAGIARRLGAFEDRSSDEVATGGSRGSP